MENLEQRLKELDTKFYKLQDELDELKKQGKKEESYLKLLELREVAQERILHLKFNNI